MSVTYKAILVGNSEFPEDPHELLKLNGPVNDVELLKRALCDSDKGLFEENNITTLINKTSGEILLALDQFFAGLTNKDQALFYYSGHGVQDRMSRLFLCAKNSRKDSLISTTVSDHTLNILFENCPSNKHIIILDCCHSGGFKGGDLPQSLQGEGRFVLTSSSSMELSSDTSSPDSPSPFTKYLSEALLTENIDVNDDGYVSINEVYEYIFPKIYQESKQRPQRKFGDTSGDLPLCKRKKIYNPNPTPKDTDNDGGTMNIGTGKPRLNVSEQKIDHLGVGSDEKLPDEIIDVFNEGSGKLDWTATCNGDWIEVENHGTYIKLKLSPKTGMNRASIRIIDKNGGGSKTIRVAVEKLKELAPIWSEPEITNKNIEKPEKNILEDEQQIAPIKLLATFQDVKMRHVNQAKSIVDNSEQSGTIQVFSDRIEFVGNFKIIIKDIDILDYYPQDINPGFTFNYMGISGTYDGVKQLMYFYNFSWFGAGQTWKMAEQIYALIKNKQLTVNNNFKTHINANQPPPQSESPPPQNNIYMPGSWNIYIYQFGQQISYLNLYFNMGGALNGTQQSVDGYSQISGTWGYNPHTKLLTYNVMVSLVNGAVPDHGSVSLQIEPNGNISGTDLIGRKWALQKTGN
ncbi:caspase domain-containing protein [Mariniflexile fucanivorans]|uniref:Caspase domain-containing protein n=1 Tax=Mariniflexile fucanivorans TaxID=264023 RepID=A0A4R1RN11_9FLAO|nr:caspase family protein [Mariniflexile fucanivorans]TCL67685.1 caspase domain-containing protein [Mariniflexile fucanivorans]